MTGGSDIAKQFMEFSRQSQWWREHFSALILSDQGFFSVTNYCELVGLSKTNSLSQSSVGQKSDTGPTGLKSRLSLGLVPLEAPGRSIYIIISQSVGGPSIQIIQVSISNGQAQGNLLIHSSNYFLLDLILYLWHNPVETPTQMFPRVELTRWALCLTAVYFICMQCSHGNVIMWVPTARTTRNGIWVVSAFIEIKTPANPFPTLCLSCLCRQKKPNHPLIFPFSLLLLPLSLFKNLLH